ncbi:hypothetical protein F4778DRAFT_721794 [Xylariomycetidae sp. FL2044]|nr:hypothetical protein F4778DRAFT_721794 [Xylariomycetidae sp. FL2044]
MARKVLILAGAPESHMLDWNNSELLDHFLDPITKLIGIDASASSTSGDTRTDGDLDIALWRSIPLTYERLATGFSQAHDLMDGYQRDVHFFSTFPSTPDATTGIAEDGMSQDVLDQFYNHSLGIHDDIPSSQLPGSSSSIDDTSFISTEDGTTHIHTQASDATTEGLRPFAVEAGHLSDLEDLPTAAYLKSISPQTMTVNLIVGIISVAEPRVVKTRWGSTKSLIELLVGDETKSGFSITFWMSPENTDANDKLRKLRRQDIVLLRNVALGVFMNKVHGHSLRKAITKIDLLHRRKLDSEDEGGLYSMKDVSMGRGTTQPQLQKTRNVREWVLHFVGGGGGAGAGTLGKRKRQEKAVRSWDLPPLDTQ